MPWFCPSSLIPAPFVRGGWSVDSIQQQVQSGCRAFTPFCCNDYCL